MLYSYGARKVVLIGVGQVGCSPNELARYSADGATCVDRIDGAIQIFNRRLVGLVDEFNALPGAHFTFINGYNIFADILANAASYGTVTIINDSFLLFFLPLIDRLIHLSLQGSR